MLEFNVLELSSYPEFNWAATCVLVWLPVLVGWKAVIRACTRT